MPTSPVTFRPHRCRFVDPAVAVWGFFVLSSGPVRLIQSGKPRELVVAGLSPAGAI